MSLRTEIYDIGRKYLKPTDRKLKNSNICTPVEVFTGLTNHGLCVELSMDRSTAISIWTGCGIAVRNDDEKDPNELSCYLTNIDVIEETIKNLAYGW